MSKVTYSVEAITNRIRDYFKIHEKPTLEVNDIIWLLKEIDRLNGELKNFKKKNLIIVP